MLGRVAGNMENPRVEELTSESGFQEAYPVMKQLRPVDQAEYFRLIDKMRIDEGYRLFALRDGPDYEIRGLAGVVVGTTLYHGKHVWVHELVVDKPHRSEGYGSYLLDWVEDWAEERGCTRVELASGLWRDEAHKFYEDNEMERYCYTFKSELSAGSPY